MDAKIDSDVFDKIAALARESRDIEMTTIEVPEGSIGLPKSIPVLIKYGSEPKIIDVAQYLEAWRTAPVRRSGVAKVTTLLSFIDLVNRHKDADSVIFAKTGWPAPQLLAVIDYHLADGTARFGGHQIGYSFPLTDEIKTWMELNGKLMDQLEFAQFLEEHAAELAAPYDGEKSEFERLFKERFAVPSELINLSRSLEIYVGQKVKRQERLQTGERTVFFEAIHTTATGEAVDIPGIFMISVPAFLDGDQIRMPARLRYRTTGGDIKWGYQLYRSDYWLRAQIKQDIDTAAGATGLPAFEGAPEQ